MTLAIAPMIAADWSQVAAIYQAGIDTGNATFAPAPPDSWETWNQTRIAACSLVARDDERVLGWAAVSPTSSRVVYAGVVEHSLYVATEVRGQGVGSQLLAALIATTEAQGMWTIQSSIFPENAASARLHARHGFRVVGRRERIGLMTYGPWHGHWRDTLLIERRSTTVSQ